MRRLVILGGGTAGTMVANKLRRRLPLDDWRITVIDGQRDHLYQPGLLFVPFGGREDLLKPRRRLLRNGIQLLIGEIAAVDPERKSVRLSDGEVVCYDYLVIATGTSPRPDQTPGLLGSEWHRTIHDFYTYDGAFALRDALQGFTGGRLVVHVVEQPIKCPVAPLEFTFLAEAFFRRREMRDQVELVYVTPLDGAFTKPIAARYLGGLLDDRKIAVETDFLVERVDADRKVRSGTTCSSRCR
jgi:sulfide:quinone oxidoreductase